MKFLSVCSGIEAASCAWGPLGWHAHAFAEIEKFPAAVLAHHYPGVPNWGDMTKFREWPDAAFDVLAGGTPCQSFSVAGLRKGLADPRGNLALVYLGILDRYRPRWMVWENVPGVLSSNGGRDFGAFLGGLAELGYGFAYRVLDAQFFGLAQRRKRVFVVGHLGDWRRAAAVLFEPESLSGHPAPRREKGEGTAPTLAARTRGGGVLGTDFDCDGGLIAFGGNNQSGPIDVATAQTAHGGTGRMDFESETFLLAPSVAHEATGAIPIQEVTKRTGKSSTSLKAGDDIGEPGDPMFTLGADSGPVTHPLDTDGSSIGICAPDAEWASEGAKQEWRVRRLTPRECERLQGFPDDYTAIPYRGGLAADGPRYKALGNSMAVPVMAWIGERIAAVDAIPEKVAA